MKIFPYISIRINRPWALMMSENGKRGHFENLPHVVPGRWGWWFVLFNCVVVEIGSRNPRDKVGTLLKRIGLWPW